MRLSPEVLRTAYDFLRTTAPYCRWNMPAGSDVRFIVTKSDNRFGDHLVMSNGKHRIRISDRFHGHTDTLLRTIAHEMLHVQQSLLDLPAEHDAEFLRLWRLVCKHHGFDPLNP